MYIDTVTVGRMSRATINPINVLYNWECEYCYKTDLKKFEPILQSCGTFLTLGERSDDHKSHLDLSY